MAFIKFDRAITNTTDQTKPLVEQLKDPYIARYGPRNAINPYSEDYFMAICNDFSNPPFLECIVRAPNKNKIMGIEISFPEGKARKVTFKLEYQDADGEYHNIGTYQQIDYKNDMQRFPINMNVENWKSFKLTFVENDDGHLAFMIKNIRLVASNEYKINPRF